MEITTLPTMEDAATEPKRTLREWLKENNPPGGLTSEICTMRCLVALGCTMRKADPAAAGRALFTRAELTTLMQEAHDLWKKTLADNKVSQEHWAPILPSDGMLFAMIIKKPEAAEVVRFQDEMLNGAMAAATGDRSAMRTNLLSQMLRDCVLYPDLATQTQVMGTYGGLQSEFSTKCQRLASEAVEDILGK